MTTQKVFARYMTFGECLSALQQEGDYLVEDSLFVYPPDVYASLQPQIGLTAPAILRQDPVTGEGELEVLSSPVFLPGPTSQVEIDRYYGDGALDVSPDDAASCPPGTEQYQHVIHRPVTSGPTWTANGIDPLVD